MLAEATELDDQRGEHERDHERKLGDQSDVALFALLDSAAGLDEGARGHRCAQFLDRFGHLLVNEGRLQSRQRFRLHGNGWQAAATPDVALVEFILELGQLTEGHRGACRRGDLEIAQRLDA